MQDTEQLPLEQWAQQLKQARTEANLGAASLAQTLRLSNAQLRALESGSLSAFHGPGYYLRAVEKYARELNITLDPPVTELKLTDSQIALNRVKNNPSTVNLAKKESLALSGHLLPTHGTRSRLGLWLAVLLAALIGAGTWLAIQEGWPARDSVQVVQIESDSDAPQPSPAIAHQANPQPLEILASDNRTNSNASTNSGNNLAVRTIVQAALPATSIDQASTQAATPTISTESVPATDGFQTPNPTPTSAVLTQPEKPTPPPDVIEAQFTEDCWVEIRFTDGRVEQRIYQPGQVLTAAVREIERMTFGNAQAVSASRAGLPFDIMAFTRAGNNVARITGDALTPR